MKEKPNIITTSRLVLKNLSENDLDRMHILFNNEIIKKTYMIKDFKSLEEENEFLHRIIYLSSLKNRFIYGIYLHDELIGFLNDCLVKDDSIELGYFIDPLHFSKGYATEVLTKAIDVLFDMGYNKVIAGYFEDNIASLKVMQKSKMVKIDKEEIIEYRGVKHKCLYCEICKY